MMSNEELIMIKGGGITSTFLNSVSRLLDTIYNLGQTVGSSLRRAISRKRCKLS